METPAVFKLPASPGIVRAGCREPQIPLLWPDYKLLPREWPPIDMYNYLSNYFWQFNISLFNFFPYIFFDIRYGYVLFRDHTNALNAPDYDELTYNSTGLKLNIAGTDYTSSWTPIGKIFTATKRTTTVEDNNYPQIVLDNSTIHSLWLYGGRASSDEVWTSVLETDQTGWVATKRADITDGTWPCDIDLSGTTLHYVMEDDYEVRTASMETDGTGWTSAVQTSTTIPKYSIRLNVSGTKIYYVWYERKRSDDIECSTRYRYEASLWTGSMDTDGTDWAASQRRIICDECTAYHFLGIDQVISGSTIYYVWHENFSDEDLYVGSMETNGTGWSATLKRTGSSDISLFPDNNSITISGTTLYYAWLEVDGDSIGQLWTATMETDGSGWSVTQQTSGTRHVKQYDFQVVGDVVHFVLTINDSNNDSQIWTVEMATDQTGWTATQRTTSAYDKVDPRLIVDGESIYYIWSEYDTNSDEQIWTAILE